MYIFTGLQILLLIIRHVLGALTLLIVRNASRFYLTDINTTLRARRFARPSIWGAPRVEIALQNTLSEIYIRKIYRNDLSWACRDAVCLRWFEHNGTGAPRIRAFTPERERERSSPRPQFIIISHHLSSLQLIYRVLQISRNGNGVQLISPVVHTLDQNVLSDFEDLHGVSV